MKVAIGGVRFMNDNNETLNRTIKGDFGRNSVSRVEEVKVVKIDREEFMKMLEVKTEEVENEHK